jgi:hypothetical protein
MLRLFPLALVALLGAQVPNVGGTWTLTYDADIRNADGKAEVRGRRDGTLVLAQHGDSLSGTWHPIPSISVPVSGHVEGAAVRFGSAWRTGEVMRDGKKLDGAELRTEFHGTVERGGMAGTMYIRIRFDGAEREPPARRWEAVRRPGG